MNLKTSIRQYLLGKQVVTALCGLRIYPNIIAQRASFPAVAINVVGGDVSHHLRGISGYTESTVQIDSVAEDSEKASDLDEAIRLSFMSPANYNIAMLEMHVDRIQDEGPIDLPMPPLETSDNWMYRVQHSYIFSHTQATS